MNEKKQIPEIITFYLDIIKDSIKRRRLTKSLKNFAEDKLKINPQCSFRAFYYKEQMEPFLSETYPNIDPIEDLIKDDWKKHKGEQESRLENGLFFCLSQIAAEAAKKRVNFRIIVLSDSPSLKSSAYQEAIMDLVETVRTFPTFIDIIRIGQQKFYKDDVELQIISRVTSGGLFYIDSDKKLTDVFSGLAKNKKLPDLRPEGGQAIDGDKKKYYENLAVDLEYPEGDSQPACALCNVKHCTYCDEDDDVPLLCPQCGFPYHECCAALHSWKFNIGFKHLFRCINCGALLKLNEETVHIINGEPLELGTISVEDLEKEHENKETWNPEEISPTQEEKTEPESPAEGLKHKLNDIFKISTKVAVEDVANLLKISRKQLFDMLMDYGEELEDFQLDGEFLVSNPNTKKPKEINVKQKISKERKEEKQEIQQQQFADPPEDKREPVNAKASGVSMGIFGTPMVRKKPKMSPFDQKQSDKKPKTKKKLIATKEQRATVSQIRRRRKKRKSRHTGPTITYCPFCAKQINSSLEVCPHCGSPIF